MNKSAVVSVIFPSNLIFFNSFLRSLQSQTEKSFDLVLITDGVEDIDTRLTEFRDSLRIFTYPLTGSIASIRKKMLDLLIGLQYDHYIFADTDDLLDRERVSVSVRYLEKYPFVVNDLITFTDESAVDGKGYWCERIENEQVFGYPDLLNHNFAGLGNTSVRRSALRSLGVPDNLQGVDWFIFFQLLMKHSGIFLHEGVVFYRQHPSNMIGAGAVSAAKLVKVADVKVRHYSALALVYPEVKPLLAREQKIYNKLTSDLAFASLAEARLNTKQMNYFWWEETEYINE
jgi:hypothetical protein